MVSIDALLLFLGTTFVVVLSPGPAVIAVSTEAVSSGVRRCEAHQPSSRWNADFRRAQNGHRKTVKEVRELRAKILCRRVIRHNRCCRLLRI